MHPYHDYPVDVFPPNSGDTLSGYFAVAALVWLFWLGPKFDWWNRHLESQS